MKMIKSFAIGAALAAFSTAGYADEEAAPFLKYGEVEGWNVYIDTNKGACLIEAVDDFENVVQMGLADTEGTVYVGVFTKADTDIRRGETGEVIISLDGDLYTGEATGMRGNITQDYSGGYILSNNPAFIEDVARSHVMTVFPEKRYSFNVDLTGTFKAIELGRQCNQEQAG